MAEEQEFERMVLQCVEDGLLILGEDGKAVVVWWWETKCNMRRKDIPSHIEEFIGLLEQIFGAGSKIIESNLAKEVQRALNLPNGKVSSLSEAVSSARRNSFGK